MNKVVINGLGRIGRAALKILVESDDLELVAVVGVFRPGAAEVEGFAALGAGEGAGDGDFIGRGVGAKLGDGVVIFLVQEDDALEDAGERVGR